MEWVEFLFISAKTDTLFDRQPEYEASAQKVVLVVITGVKNWFPLPTAPPPMELGYQLITP